MNGYLLAGTITGVIVGLVLASVLLRFAKKNKGEKFTYDERQKSVRGDAYKYAFYTLVVYNAAYGILDMCGIRWAETLTGVMIGVCIAVLVHVIYCIWHECYFSMNEEPVRVLIVFGIIALINVIIAVRQGVHGALIENGLLTSSCANLVVAIMFGLIVVVLAVKRLSRKNEAEEE